MTVFGDVVAPRGGEIAYAGLARVLEAFGVNDSQLRTALSRLVAEKWLASQRVGRSAFYALSDAARHRSAEAEARIYAAAPGAWNGRWCVAILPDLTPNVRESIRKPLSWLGFGAIGPQTMIHPRPDPAALGSLLADIPAGRHPLVVDGVAGPVEAARALVRQGWDLDALGRGYQDFLDAFAPLARAKRGAIDPYEALAGRIRLVHAFRRLALRDPDLPPELLPGDWIGVKARRFAGRIYAHLRPASERWIDANLFNAKGKLPSAAVYARRRFGG